MRVERDRPTAARRSRFRGLAVAVQDDADSIPRFAGNSRPVEGEDAQFFFGRVHESEARCYLLARAQSKDGMRFAQCDKVADELKKFVMRLFQLPVDFVD